MSKPYIENKNIRLFSENTEDFELVWHRDKEDRIIEPIHDSNWKFQLDNNIPKKISKTFVPKETYHRLIKGTGDLKLKVTKL